MSFLMPREHARAARGAANTCNDLARRMVNLPRSIMGGFSRAIEHGISIMGGAVAPLSPQPSSRRDHQDQEENFQWQHEAVREPSVIPEEWGFLASFEEQYGLSHPFFYACRFAEALKIAQDERKLMFMYLHSPTHPFTPSFCGGTLGSELVVQFLDANFVSWGALASRGEGLQMATVLRVAGFPFCAIVAPASADNILVLQQIEGPVSPDELVEILQRVMEEQGSAFGGPGAKQLAEKRQADHRLREEQDAAYLASLRRDQEKDRSSREVLAQEKESNQKPTEAKGKAKNDGFQGSSTTKQQIGKVEKGKETQPKEILISGKDPPQSLVTKILIRFPNGERREQSFLCTDKIQSIYTYIDSQALPGIGSYRLISSFPRKVYGFQQMGMTLKEAGFHPRATLFLELL
ncbi:plant UBX domain-containing protein 10-like [Telopea speciosissima]|uniref:plant UBX domain-containing protein 10-like n=1 Tax=Telopea speciosissima TaxID=54955 RepID=UPI001CC51F99|nr:plant UBX domain-containing protein 10-like [Telopea speciosissima]